MPRTGHRSWSARLAAPGRSRRSTSALLLAGRTRDAAHHGQRHDPPRVLDLAGQVADVTSSARRPARPPCRSASTTCSTPRHPWSTTPPPPSSGRDNLAAEIAESRSQI